MFQILILLHLITVTLVTFAWSMEAVRLREDLKSVSTMLGALCVATVSVVMMPELPADNLEILLV